MGRVSCVRILFGLLLSVFAISPAAAAPIATTTALTTSPSGSSSFHDLVILTATVADANHAAVLSGTVTFSNGSASLGTVQMVATSSGGHTPGTATLRLTSLPVGTNSLTAKFNGTNADASSSSAARSFTVAATTGGNATGTSLASTRNPNGSFSLTAMVEGFGTATPTGSVTFTDSTTNTTLGAANLTAATGSPGFFVTGTSPESALGQVAAIGDFNNDGKLDLVYEVGSARGFNVWLGNGDGTFSPGPVYTGSAVQNVPFTVGDFNQDGNLDLAIIQSSTGVPPFVAPTIGILLGNGDGSFQSPINLSPANDGDLESVVQGDFNGDGIPDLAAVTGLNSTLQVFVLPGIGDGTFGAQDTTDLGWTWPDLGNTVIHLPLTNLASADLNHDGNLDLVIGFWNQAAVLLGNGTGGFSGPVSFPFGSSTEVYQGKTFGQLISSVSIADLNGDGNPDLIIICWGVNPQVDGLPGMSPLPAQASVLLGNASGTFPTYGTYVLPSPPTLDFGFGTPIIGDFNFDGKLDIAAANPFRSSTPLPLQLQLLAGNGDGTFQQAQGFSIPSIPSDSVPSGGDFRGIGRPDLAVPVWGTGLDDLTFASGATASLNSIFLPGTGQQTVVAEYSGDSTYAPSTSNPATLVPIEPATVLIAETGYSPPVNIVAGATVSFTVTVVGVPGSPIPTGTVQCFQNNGPVASPATLTAGTATCSASFPQPGTYQMSAQYSGDATYHAGVGTLSVSVVTQGTVTVSVASGGGTHVVDVPFTISMTLGDNLPGPAPTGTLTLVIDGTTVGTTTLSGNPPFSSSFTVNSAAQPLTLGTHTIQGRYSGDIHWAAATATGASVTILNPELTLSSNLTASLLAWPTAGININATIATPPGSPPPTGTIQFYDGAAAIGAPIPVAGSAAALSSTFALGNHSITAVYSGDTNYPTATSPPLAFTVVNHAVLNLAVTHAPTNVIGGVSFQVWADFSLNPPVFGAPSPTGTVTVFGNGTQIATGTYPQSSIYTVNTVANPLPVGIDSLTLSYSGDSNWPATTSAPFQIVVSKNSLTLYDIGVSASAVSTGTEFFISALPKWGGAPDPTGDIEIVENGSVLASSPIEGILSNFYLNYPVRPLAAGTHTFTVYYPGDASWNSASAGPLSVTITQIAPAMSLTSNLGTFGSVVQGTTIMYSAKLTGALSVTSGSHPYPTGGVQFYVDGVVAGSPIPLVNGVAVFSTSALTPGQHTITAGYGGDTFYDSATTSGVVTVVTQGPDVLTLSSATPSTGALGAAITVNGTLTTGALGPAPTGTVALLDNGQSIATVNLAGSSPVALAFTINTAMQPITAGAHSFSFSYGGEAHWIASNSAPVVVTLAKGATSTAVSSSASSEPVGSSVMFTAAITPPGFVAPTGTVQFYDGIMALGSPVAVSNGSAAYSTNALASGTHSITAVYSGDSNYATSTSAALVETITASTRGSATVSVTSSSPSVAINTNVTFTAALAISQGSPDPTGTVQFYDGAATLGSPVPVANSSASYSTTTLAGGSHSITAAYSGDANYSPSTSAVVTESVEDFSFRAGTATLTITPGGSGTSVLTVTPEGGFDVSTNFACSGLPQEATCSFSPATVTGSGTTTLTIATTGNQALVSRPASGWRSAAGATLVAGVFWLILPLPGRSRRRKLGGAAFLLFAFLEVLAGCGGGSSSKPTTGNSGTPAGTYNVTVTATSGSGTSAIVHTTSVTVIVQ